MIELVSAFSETNTEDKLETTAADSPLSGRQMQIVQCNGIPVYVDLKDRVCLPVEENVRVV